MKRLYFFVMIGVLVATQAYGNVIIGGEKRVIAKFPEGSENYVAVYQGILQYDVREDGHPAIPSQGWFTDTRQCYWDIRGFVERRVYLTNRAGQRFERNNARQVYEKGHVGQGSDFKLTELRPENCNDAQARRDSDINNIRQNILSSFDEIINRDAAPLKDYMQKELGTNEIIIE